MTRSGTEGATSATLVEALRRSAQGPSAALGYSFLADGDEVTARLSFERLHRRARAIGSGLTGVSMPGDRAVLLFPPGLEFIEGLFGCFEGGVVAVPTPWQRPGRSNPQLGAIVEDSGATLALTTRAVLKMRERFIEGEPRLASLRWLAVEDFVDVHDGPSVPVKPDDLAFLQYTSGSTGSPKGVMLPHRAALANVEGMRRRLGLEPGKVGVSWLPPFHDMGLIGNILQVAHTGMDLVLMPPAAFVQAPIRWLRAISRYGAYVSGGPNFAFDLCVRTIAPADCDGFDLRSWKVAYVGAEPVSPRTLGRFADAFAGSGFRPETFYPCYGLAEATLMVTGGDRSAVPIIRRLRRDELTRGLVVEASDSEPDSEAHDFAGCGQAVPDTDVLIVDPSSGEPVDAGHVGEIWVSGPGVGDGYWGRPEATEATFLARIPGLDGRTFLRTGDFGFLDGEELFVSGRLKDMIIIRGKNHFPQDIEEVAASAHPALKPGSVVAFGSESPDGESRLELLAEVSRHSRSDESEAIVEAIRRAVASQLGLSAHAVTLARASSLPRTSSGKSRRQECRRLALAGGLDVVHHWAESAREEVAPARAPRGRREVRDWLVERIARHLNTSGDRVSTAEPFANFGLDSVSMVTISAELGDLLGRTLSPTLLYDAPTIAALAEAVGGEGPPSSSPLPLGEAPGVRDSARRVVLALDSLLTPGDAASLTPDPSPRGRGEEEGSEPIAIIGGGCRLPGADSLEGFWELLRQGRDVIGEIPERRRWSRPPGPIASMAGGFLPEVDQFDAGFFGISPREAAYVDPQHRLLLEVAWEALENAGLAADTLAGRAVGVFAGVGGSDYGRMLGQGPGLVDSYWGTGNAANMAANRVSYHLDLTGPSLTVDTACSSSLVAVHLAVQSLREGECELALAAGVNLILAPEVSVALTKAQMLSPTGRCRAFDARADGYVRGEGCGVAVLKPLAAALRDGDRVLAVIRGSAINQDGKSNGITAPNGASQAALIRSALRDAGASAGEIGCVEAHGSGTILGDPIEVDALKAVLDEGPLPCAIGTVKTNLGHLEAAAGIAGLLKAALQLDRGLIARHLHHESTNPQIHLEGTRFFIPDEPCSWPSAALRLAGVSSFGFGGTNAHVVLEQSPAPAPSSTSRPSHLLAISARSNLALKELAGQYVDHLSKPLSLGETADLCQTAGAGRVHFAHRLAVRGDSAEGLREALTAFLDGRAVDGVLEGEARRDAEGRVAFLFTGQGALHAGMGRTLYATCDPFRQAIERVDAALRAIGEPPVGRAFEADEPAEKTCPQVTLFALEYSLVATWRSWGVVPALVLGHSLGEYVAACVAGVFSLEDALRLVAGRGRLMTELCPSGAMAAVFATLDVVAEAVAPWAESLAVAAINGPSHIAISGAPGSVQAACDEFQRRGISTQAIDVPLAFHSPLIEPALAAFGEIAARVAFSAPTIPLISNLTGRPVGDEIRDPAYWSRHARQPVRFLDGLLALQASGVDTFLEIGPTGTLAALGRVGLPADESLAFAPSLRRGRNDWRTMLDALGVLYIRGVPIDWRGLDAAEKRRKVALPTYPFERQRHWFAAAEAPEPASPVRTFDSRPALGWESKTRWDHEVARSSSVHLSPLAAITEGLEPLAIGLFNDKNPAGSPGQKADFDWLAACYAVAALRDLGWEPAIGERVTVFGLADRLGVPAKYRRFFGRMVQVLAEEGYLEPAQAGWIVVRVPERLDMPALLAEMMARHPDWSGELKLAGQCGEALGKVLRGTVDPLEVLFPGGSAALLEGLYEDSPVARMSNRVVARAVERAVEQAPSGRVVRILELGAGTGGTTSHVLPGLPSGRCEYVFSDISAVFLGRAREKFAAYDFVEYRALDLEADPDSSGLAAHQFDVILAANVLHATADLRQTLTRVRRLLAPSGLLVLLEGTGPQRLPDMVFGMAEGWWKFTDVELRGAHPLLARRAWVELLESEGFAEAATLPGLVDEDEPDQAVILARGPAVVDRVEASPIASRNLGWLIFSDGEIGPALSDRLGLAGESFVMVEADEAPTWLGDDAEFRRRLILASEALGRPHLGVVHLWGLDPANSLAEALGLGLGLAIRIDRAASLIAESWLVTRGGTIAGSVPLAEVADPAQAALWDFARSLQASAGRRTKRIDLDPLTGAEGSAERLASEILRPDNLDTLAYRGDRRLASRVESATIQAGASVEVAPLVLSLTDEGPTREEVLAAEPAIRRELLEKILRMELGRVLSIDPGEVPRDVPVNALGLDSLMAIQLKNRIELRTGVTLSIVTLLEGLSIARISTKMNGEIEAGEGLAIASFKPVNGKGHDPLDPTADHRHDAAPGRSTLDQMVADLESLPESELDSLLDDLLGPEGFGDVGDDDRSNR